LKQLKLEYHGLYDDNKWLAAAHATDKAVNKNFGRVNKSQATEIKNLVNTLIQSANNNSGKSSSLKWTKVKGKTKNSSNKSEQNNPNCKSSGCSNTHHDVTQGMRTPPLRDGESENKFIDGKKKYWCAKCNQWTLSHGTDRHQTKEKLKAELQPTTGMSRINFDLHPSAFMTLDHPINGRAPSWSEV